MKTSKICLYILLTFLLSGCSMDYKLTIDSNMILEEEVRITEENKVVYKFSLDPSGYVDDSINNFKLDEKYNYYVFGKDLLNNKTTGIGKATYIDFEEFKSKNTIKDYFFSDILVRKTGSIVTLNFISNKTNELFESDTQTDPTLTDAFITIILPFKVIQNNADVINLENNSYIWKYNVKNFNKDISLSFDTSKKTAKIIQPITYVIISFIVIILGGGIYIYYKYKKNSML